MYTRARACIQLETPINLSNTLPRTPAGGPADEASVAVVPESGVGEGEATSGIALLTILVGVQLVSEVVDRELSQVDVVPGLLLARGDGTIPVTFCS
jgi:hypothetical protein